MQCSKRFGKHGNPVTDPSEFQKLRHTARAFKIFDVILDAMSSDHQSEQRQSLNEKHAVSIIDVMLVWPVPSCRLVPNCNNKNLEGARSLK